jgi:serine/threonine protein kinase
MKGIFNALEYLHDTANVIHRDIKPENIVITDYDDLTKVKLIDFGLAKRATKKKLQDYAKCGTLLYTPPEQVLNNFAYAKVNSILTMFRKPTCGPLEL